MEEKQKVLLVEEGHRYIVPLTIAISFVALTIAALYYFGYGETKASAIFTYCSVMCLTSLFVRSDDLAKYHRIRSNFIFFHFFLGVLGGMHFTGGFNSSVAPWLCLIPILSYLIGTKEDSLFWSILCCIGLSSYYYVFVKLISLPYDLVKSEVGAINFITNIALIIVASILGHLVQHNRKRLFEEKEELREASFHKSKLEALGEIAGGVAHEINNPLQVISGRTYLLKKLLKSDKEQDLAKAKNAIDSIDETVTRIANIVSSLKKLTRTNQKSDEEQKPLNAIVPLEDMLNISAERLRSKGIKVNWNNTISEDQQIVGDSVQLIQVLINLINNSIDSLEEYADESRHWINIESYISNGNVCIKVTDGGDPIPETVISNLFKPFFTTKEIGKGTGIGLSLSKKIIENHNGELKYIGIDNVSFLIQIPVAINDTKKAA